MLQSMKSQKGNKMRMGQKADALWLLGLLLFSFGFAFYITAGYNLPEQIAMSTDSLLGEAIMKSIQEDGLIGNYVINRLGAPETSVLYDTPFLDVAFILGIRILAIFMNNTSKIYMMFYWLTYVTASLTMFFLLKKLRCSNPVSFVFSILFSFSTYHTYRNTFHMTLSNYWIVPLAVYLAIAIAWDGECDSREYRIKGKKRVGLLVIAALLGISNIYFAAFGLFIVVLSLLYRMIKSGKVIKNIKYAIYPLMIVASVAASMLPKIVYTIRNGANAASGARYFWEAQTYGLKLIQLLLPARFSRLGNASALTEDYIATNPYISENYFASIGLICVIGFIGICVHFVLSYVKGKKEFLGDICAYLVLACLLFAMVGGVGELFNFFVTPEIRCYNRISIFIICFSLIYLAVNVCRWNKRKYIQFMILPLMLVIAYFDQITVYDADYWTEAGNAAEVYCAFYGTIEEKMEDGAMIYQVPYINFPESETVQELDCYDQLQAYVYTDTLRWSHGGVDGRNEAAESLYSDDGYGISFVENIIEAGFSGVCVYLDGYTEEEGQNVIAFYSETLGLDAVVSDDGRIYFFDLTGAEEELSAISACLKSTKSILKEMSETYEISKKQRSTLANYIVSGQYANAAQMLYDLLPESVTGLSNEEFVEEMYRCLLGRESDTGGKSAAIENLESGLPRQDFISEMLSSDEFLQRCGILKQ